MSDKELENNHSNKHAARFIAILSLYSYSMSDDKKINLAKTSANMKKAYRLKDIFDLEISDEELNNIELHSPDEEFLDNLISLADNKSSEIEDLIKANLIAKWNLDKLDKVIQAILKLAALELLYNGEIPAKIIIDEYVSLTKSFYENSEAGFINKVIDTMAKQTRTEEMA